MRYIFFGIRSSYTAFQQRLVEWNSDFYKMDETSNAPRISAVTSLAVVPTGSGRMEE